MQIEQGNLVLAGILRDAFERTFHAGEEPVAETVLAPVEPFAGLLEIQPSEAAEANGSRQRGGGRRGLQVRENVLPRASGLGVLVERLKPPAQLRLDLRRDLNFIRVGAAVRSDTATSSGARVSVSPRAIWRLLRDSSSATPRAIARAGACEAPGTGCSPNDATAA